MRNYAISLKRTSVLLVAVALTASLLAINFASFFAKADAAQLTSRKVELVSNLAGDNASGTANVAATNGAATKYTFTFTPSTTSIGSVLFQVCTNAVGTCAAPTYTGQGFGAATFTSTSLAGTAWAAYTTSLASVSAGCTGTNGLTNCIAMSASAGAAQTATPQTVVFSSVKNPNVNQTYFVHITTYGTTAFATPVDDGTVAFAISEEIIITARVAETLGFSTTGDTGAGLTADGSGPCNALTGSGAIWLGDPTEHTLDMTQAYENYSFFRVYTNAGTGVDINYYGPTLTRSGGGPTIDATAANAASTVGAEQFGLAIAKSAKDNNTTNTGTTINSRSSTPNNYDLTNLNTLAADWTTTGHLTPEVNLYDGGSGTISNGGGAKFSFTPSASTKIAGSSGYITCDTAAVRYVANIAPTTEAGTYTTTLVYAAVPTF